MPACLARDTWIHWTWGNQKTLRRASALADRGINISMINISEVRLTVVIA